MGERIARDLALAQDERTREERAERRSRTRDWKANLRRERRERLEREQAPTVDMRGSRIEVHQEFREADPDRVMIQMADALGREAIFRTQSGFVPPLAR
ncbi:unnamed protein product [marine sediment metagenome]|uniref:Uncharacterized protein n=1 Tax=marine sediment metagenome TaxID=412755 RepID=X0UH89_9ZZZZ